jgi:phospholipid/cholesterol/gamma-HCH transport system permease protein
MDLVWSCLTAVAMAIVIMLVHTYYGFTATGGPSGVGEAVGRAVRTSLIVTVFVVLAITLAIYGRTPGLNLSG